MTTTARPKPPNAGKGRPKGVPNKSTVTVRQAILETFDKLGGVKWLLKFAATHPAEFAKMLSRLLPREVVVSGNPDAAPPASLSDPAVLDAALNLDQVADAVSHAAGAGPVDAPTLPMGAVPSHDSSDPAPAADQATAAP